MPGGLVNLVVTVPDQATDADHHRLGGLTVRALLEEGPHEGDARHGLPKPHLIGHFNSLSSSPTQSHTCNISPPSTPPPVAGESLL